MGLAPHKSLRITQVTLNGAGREGDTCTTLLLFFFLRKKKKRRRGFPERERLPGNRNISSVSEPMAPRSRGQGTGSVGGGGASCFGWKKGGCGRVQSWLKGIKREQS